MCAKEIKQYLVLCLKLHDSLDRYRILLQKSVTLGFGRQGSVTVLMFWRLKPFWMFDLIFPYFSCKKKKCAYIHTAYNFLLFHKEEIIFIICSGYLLDPFHVEPMPSALEKKFRSFSLLHFINDHFQNDYCLKVLLEYSSNYYCYLCYFISSFLFYISDFPSLFF